MGSYKAIYIDGLFRGMDYRLIESLSGVWFAVGPLLIIFAFFIIKAKTSDSDLRLRDLLLFLPLFAVFVTPLAFFCKNTGAIEIVDTKTGKTVVVADEEIAHRTISALKTIDYVGEQNRREALTEDAVKEILNK